jgi:hypothetical protein
MNNSLFDHGKYISTGAEFSSCRTWRYTLWRIWDEAAPYLNVIGLNPSTATETLDDPTIRRCIAFARSWGYGGLYMTNAFAFRATLPKVMKKAAEPVGADNDLWLKKTAESAGLVVAAWGREGGFRDRDRAILTMIPNLHCFRVTPKTGYPEHPLYLPGDLKPIPYKKEE